LPDFPGSLRQPLETAEREWNRDGERHAFHFS
jgi:hypothetical protein